MKQNRNCLSVSPRPTGLTAVLTLSLRLLVARHVTPISHAWLCILIGNFRLLHDLSAIPDVIRQQSHMTMDFDLYTYLLRNRAFPLLDSLEYNKAAFS